VTDPTAGDPPADDGPPAPPDPPDPPDPSGTGSPPPDLDPGRFPVHTFEGRGFAQAYVRVGAGPGRPAVVLVHGWPETKRIWWRVIDPLAAAGFDVIVPDLRGFGDSAIGPDGLHDVVAHSLDVEALVRGLGHDRAVLVAGDLGGPVVQDLALRTDLADRMVLFNCPLPYDKARMAGLRTVHPSTHDYFVRQATDADGLAAELTTPEQRRRYIATFYTSRLWAHPGAFDDVAVAFHSDPFGDADKLRATFGAYESVVDPAKRTDRPAFTRNDRTRTAILFGTSDHVIGPDFDRMAALVFGDHVGPLLLRDCGHFVPWEAPHALVSLVVAMCPDRLGPPAGSAG
jgi:pimeloyl-ACP methyl ester carboxylesterase